VEGISETWRPLSILCSLTFLKDSDLPPAQPLSSGAVCGPPPPMWQPYQATVATPHSGNPDGNSFRRR
jgi:hypothetical protein